MQKCSHHVAYCRHHYFCIACKVYLNHGKQKFKQFRFFDLIILSGTSIPLFSFAEFIQHHYHYCRQDKYRHHKYSWCGSTPSLFFFIYLTICSMVGYTVWTDYARLECHVLSVPVVIYKTFDTYESSFCKYWMYHLLIWNQIARFMGPTCGTPGSYRPQMGPMLAPWSLLSANICISKYMNTRYSPDMG